MKNLPKFDLGGIGKNGDRLTVNINAICDIEADFTDLDSFCDDGSVGEFYLSHSLEHVPSGRYADFLRGMLRKLHPGGVVKVVHSDIVGTLRLWSEEKLSFRAMRTVVFPPADRLRQNTYHQHFNMWGPEELAEDFRACGFGPVETFNAGSWRLDTMDELHPGAVEIYHGLMIPNLGIKAYRPLEGSSTGFNQQREICLLPDNTEGRGLSKVTAGGIPKIIHQTWKNREVGSPFRQEWIDSWLEQNDGWGYKFWTDEDLEEFVAKNFPDFLPFYQAYDIPIKRVDAARYLVLKEMGGVFVDLDFICLQPLEKLLADHRLVFGSQHPGAWVETADHVCNAFMASAPNHPFWNGIAFDLSTRIQAEVVEAGGPKFLTQRASNAFFFLEKRDLPTVLPHDILYPLAWHDTRRFALRGKKPVELHRMFPTSTCVTLWTASWWGK